jgi:hypothetical protein
VHAVWALILRRLAVGWTEKRQGCWCLLFQSLPALQRLSESFMTPKSKYPGCQWIYGNVYDPADGVTPLNWWLDK